MSVNFFNGPPGVGKSFQGTAYALHCLDLGLRVAVSWDLTPPEGVRVYDLRRFDDAGEPRTPDLTIAQANAVDGPVVFRFKELLEVFGLVGVNIFKDEAQNDLGSRDWEKMPLKVRIWMSMHRHFRTNLFLYTQHFKFVDIYPRRLAIGNVSSLARFLNLTFEMPRPQADSETGELGPVDLLGIRVIVRPWKSLDLPVPIPGFWKLAWNLSRRVPAHYNTHVPPSLTKKAPDAGAALPASSQTAAPF